MKEGARYSRLSVRMGCVSSWWPSGRDGTDTKERHGDKIRRHLQVKDGGEKTRNSR